MVNGCSPLSIAISHGEGSLLASNHKVAATVLLPAGLVLVAAERLFLPLADHGEPARRHTQADQVVLHRGCATVAEAEIVFGAAARVAVTFERHLDAGPLLHPVRVLLQRRLRVVAHR